MADSTVLLEVIVEGKNIKIVQKQVEDLGASINKSSKATDKDSKAKKKNKKATDDLAAGQKNFNKGQKGVAGATANGTKAFSKQREAIGGSSGLVGAYATLAANIFAATAAFGALQRAAQFEKLLQGFEAIAATTGRTSSIIVQSLKDITDGALSTEQAASSAAAGINAGFSTSEIERLAGVAKNAAVALGRNLPDAIDRLVRGTAKIEPEILDELGIFVRLDDAVEKYAISLGKSASALNQAQRRQAFLNETLEQGELKFGILEGVVTPDKYTKLAASFDDLTKTVLKFFSAIASPVVTLLAQNTGFLLSTLVLFGSSIAGQVFPIITKLGDKFTEAALKSKAAADKIVETTKKTQAGINASVGNIDPIGNAKVLSEVKAKALKGELIQTEELQKAENSIAGSIAQKTGKVRKGIKARAGLTAEARSELKVEIQNLKTLREQLKTIQALKEADQQRAKAQAQADKAQRRSEREGNVAGRVGEIQSGGAVGGFGTALTGLKEFKAESGDINAQIMENVTPGIKAFEENLKRLPGPLGKIGFNSDKLIGRVSKLGAGLRVGGVAVRLFGAAFVNALPFIGQIIFGLSLLAQGLKAVFRFIFPVNKGLETLEKVSDGLAEKTRILNKTQSNYVAVLRRQKIEQALTAAGGKELGSSLELITDEQMALIDAQVESAAAARLFREETKQASGILIEISDGFSDAVKEQTKFETALDSSATKMEKLQRLVQNVVRPVIIFIQTAFRNVAEAIEAVVLSITEALPSMDSLTSAFNSTMDGIKKAIGSLVDSITGPYKAAWDLISRVFPSATDAAEEFVNNGLNTAKDGLMGLADTTAEFATGFGDSVSNSLKITEGLNAGIQQLADTTEEAARTNSVLAAGIEKEFGPRGIVGTFKALINSGMGVAEAMTQIQVRVGRVEAAVTTLDSNIDNINKSFTTLTEQSSKFLTKFKNKNPLSDLNDAAVNASETLGSLGESLRNAGQDTELVNSLVKESGVDFDRLGLSIDDVAEKGAEALNPLLNSLTAYSDAITTAKDETERLKNEISNLKINFDADKAFTDFKARLLGFSKEGKFEIAIEDQLEIKLGDIEKERTFLQKKQELEIDQIKQKYAVLEAELMVADALTGSAIALSKAAEVLADPSKAATPATATTATSGPAGATGDPVDPQQALRDDIRAKFDSLTTARDAAIGNVELKTKEAINRLGEKEIGLFASAITDAVTAASAGETTGDRITSLVNAGGFQQIAESADILRGKIEELGETGEISDTVMKEMLAGIDTEEFKANIEATKQVLSPMLEDLKSLGPEGALVASIGEGLFTVSESFVTFADKQATTAEKIAAVGNIIASIGAIANAASQQRIAGIDKEIQAEKKRDGKSKESLAKIAQLEKKKEAMEKKAFDRNKKMQMAMVVMNAAATIAGILANESPKLGAFAVPLAFAIGGLALAQLAIIAGTSYQGGGGSGGASQSAPSTITAGQRSNTVDLARSQSAGGELGYLRGESGTGGSGNFTPAFMGARYRAMGGNAGYVVGEQGPELFVPDTPGTVVPNEDVATQPAQNVNFSIQALDASGVETILTEQRGNIIGMLREAANSYGDSFLEDVNVGVYTPDAQGAGKA